MKSFFSFLWEVSKIVVIALLIVIPIRYFLFQPFFVKGQSMEPNFENGDYLIVDELSYRLREPERGEVVVFKYPNDPSQRYIKRIVGLPTETVEVRDGEIFVYSWEGKIVLDESGYLSDVNTSGTVKITLGEDEFFVLGDNRGASSDSRIWGALPEKNIIGRTFLRAWPFSSLDKINTPEYNE